MKGNKRIDERVQISVNLARIKTHGLHFEIVIQPDAVVQYKRGDKNVTIEDTITSQEIFSDAKKGEFASPEDLKKAFQTTDVLTIVKEILTKGEIQFTQKYRQEMREQTRRQVISLIHQHAINPKTNLPHPETRIEAAMEEAKVRLPDFKKAKDLVDEVVQKLRPIIPISLASVQLQIQAPSALSGKIHGTAHSMGKVLQEQWQTDGSLSITIEIPAGLQHEYESQLQNAGRGEVTITKK